MSDARLIINLTKAGVPPEESDTMDTTALLDRWAKVVHAGGDKTPPGAATSTSTVGYDVALERERLTFEKRKWEIQMAAEREAREVEREKLALERQKLAFEQQRNADEINQRQTIAERELGVQREQLDGTGTHRVADIKAKAVWRCIT